MLPLLMCAGIAAATGASQFAESDFWKEHGFETEYLYDRDLWEDHDLSQISGLLTKDDKPFVTDFSILNSIWLGSEEEFGADFMWNREGLPVLKLGYQQSNPEPQGMAPVMMLWDRTIDLVRDFDLVMRASVPNSDLLRVTRGDVQISRSFKAHLYAEDLGSAVANIADGTLRIAEGASVLLNGSFGEGGFGIRIGSTANALNEGMLSIETTSNGQDLGIKLENGGRFENASSGTLSISSAHGILALSGSNFINEGIASIKTVNKGIQLNSGATFKNSGELRIESSNSGLMIETGASFVNSGTLSVSASQALLGTGKFLNEGGKLFLDGSVDQFKGTYLQTQGTLELGESAKLHTGLTFAGAEIVGASKNIFNISSEGWESSEHILRPLFGGNLNDSVSTLVLTDKEADISYLSAIGKLLPGTSLVFTGTVKDESSKITSLSLKQYREIRENQSTSNLVLANSVLYLADGSLNEKVMVGSLGMEEKNSPLVLHENADVKLYSSSGNVFLGASEVSLNSGASLQITGIVAAEASKKLGNSALIEAPLSVSEGAKLTLDGSVIATSSAPVTVSGKLETQANSSTEFSSVLTIAGGEMSVGKNSLVEAGKIKVDSGKFESSGVLLVKDELSFSGASEFSFAANAVIDKLVLDTSSRTEVFGTISDGAEIRINKISGNGLSLGVTGAEGFTSLAVSDISGLKDSSLTAGKNSLLLLGDKGVSGLDKTGALGLANQVGQTAGSALLAVNDTVDFAGGLKLVIGATQKNACDSLHLGKDSILMVTSSAINPAFVSSTGEGKNIYQEEGSKLFIVDPFKTHFLTDENVDFNQAFEGENLLSANKSIDLEMVRENDRWMIKKKVAQKALSSFVYPNLQTAILKNGAGLESGNAGEEFFLRADNVLFMNAAQSKDLIGQTTQMMSLLAVRPNAYSALESQHRSLAANARDLLYSGKAEAKPFFEVQGGMGEISGLGGYVSNGDVRTKNALAQAGISTAIGSSVYSAGIAYQRSDGKSRHAVIESKNKQDSFGMAVSAVRSFGIASAGFALSAGRYQADLSADLPSSMLQGKAEGKVREWLFSASVPMNVRLSDNFGVTFEPTFWHFKGETLKTKIGGKEAFVQSNKNQNFAEFLLTIEARFNTKTKKGYEVESSFNAGGSLKAGQLKRKGVMGVKGYAETDVFKQQEFSPWSARGAADITFKKKNKELSFGAAVRKTRYSVDGSIGVKASFTF